MKIKRFFYRMACGFFLGLSVIAPGFSGSIIAIIMGLYQDMLRIISNPFKDFKKNVIFCVPLGLGAVAAAAAFIVLFKLLFESYEKATYLLFVGLVAGNIPVIFREVKKSGFRPVDLSVGTGAFIAALALSVLAEGFGNASGANEVTSGLLNFALGGFFGGAAVMVPGMSVSLVLIIAGVYSQLIFIAEALIRLDFTNLFPFGLFGVCAVIGLVAASRGIKRVFDEHRGVANAAVFGFLSGSLIGVLIQSLRLEDPGFNWFQGGLMLVAGLGVSMLFVFLGRKLNAEHTA